MSHEFGLTTFSSSGKLVQVEYALNAVANGNTALGIKAKNGVVLAAEKKISTPLIVDSNPTKIKNLMEHTALTYAGMGPDFRVMVAHGQKEGQKYKLRYNEKIPVDQMSKHLARTMQEFTQSGGVRPFGISLLAGGYDDKGPHLYQVDPSGTFFGCKAAAIGKGASAVTEFLKKRYNDDIEIVNAIHTAILALREGSDGEINEHKMEVGFVDSERRFKILGKSELKDYIREVL